MKAAARRGQSSSLRSYWQAASEPVTQLTPPHRLRLIAVAVIAVVSFLIASCNELPAEPIEILNQSDQRIDLIAIVGSDENLLAEILPQSAWSDPSGCIHDELEARLEGGAVIGTRSGEWCQGDPPWIITQQDVDNARQG